MKYYILLLFFTFSVLNVFAAKSGLSEGKKYYIERDNGDPVTAIFVEEKDDYFVFSFGKSPIYIYKKNILEIVEIADNLQEDNYYRFEKGERYVINLENDKIIKGAFTSETDSIIHIKSGYASFQVRKSDIKSIKLIKTFNKDGTTVYGPEEAEALYYDYFLMHSYIPVNDQHLEFKALFSEFETSFSPIRNLNVKAVFDIISLRLFVESLYSFSIVYNIISDSSFYTTLRLNHSGYLHIEDLDGKLPSTYDLIKGFEPEFYSYNSFGAIFTHKNKKYNFSAGIDYLFGTNQFNSGLMLKFGGRYQLNEKFGWILECQDIIAYKENFLLAIAGFYFEFANIRLKLGVVGYSTTERVNIYTHKDKKWKSGDMKAFPLLGVEVSMDKLVGFDE